MAKLPAKIYYVDVTPMAVLIKEAAAGKHCFGMMLVEIVRWIWRKD